MAFDFASLEPQIHRILSAPGTDLSTISAKRVRRQLAELDPSLSGDFLKENKDAIGLVIARVFEQVSGAQGLGGDEYPAQAEEEEKKPSKSRKVNKEEDEETNGGEDYQMEDDDGETPPLKKSKKGGKKELTDAEYARRLSSEINGRNTRTGSKPTKKAGRPKKSAATVDSDDSDGSVKRRKPTSAKGGFAKEFILSDPLASLLQVDKLSRPQVVKHLWVYIKAHELQNPSNKREIMCDGNFKAVFGVDKIDMFKMNKVLGQHLHENEA